MSDFNFLYELHNQTGECVLTQSVTDKRIAPILEHIARIVNEQGDVTVHIIKARVGESVLVDPTRMESLSALVTVGIEHYSGKIGDLVVENAYSPKSKIIENLYAVLSNPKKTEKLIEAVHQGKVYKGAAAVDKDFKKRQTAQLRWEKKNMSPKKVNEAEDDNQPVADKMGETVQKFGYKQHRKNTNEYTHINGARVQIEPKGWMHQNGVKIKYGTSSDKLKSHLEKIHGKISEAEDPKDTLKLPDLNTGDTLLVGKFKNRRAEIKGFSNDEHNQPVADTTKGDQKIFKPRIAKLMPGAEENPKEEPVAVTLNKKIAENVQGDVRKRKEENPEKYCADKKCLWSLRSGPCPKHGKK